jgi:GH15 family glucan-1,4-alpha-glucosidase
MNRVIHKKVKQNFRIIKRCCIKTSRGVAVLASFRRSRYPYVYPRDAAGVSRTLKFMALHRGFEKEALELLGEIARFIVHIQSKDGFLGQRYSITGIDKSIYKQEDNVAHGITIIGNYLTTAYNLNKKIRNKEKFIESMIKGVDYALKNYYKPKQKLFFSTSSIHQASNETGYTIWTNFSYFSALGLLEEVLAREIKKKLQVKYGKFKKIFEKTLRKKFIKDSIFVHRITKSGKYDKRPDITQLSPFYFVYRGLEGIIKNTMKHLKKTLWDYRLGLLMRYPCTVNDISMHNHGGCGVFLGYSAIYARYLFRIGKIKEGDNILKKIDSYTTKKGYIAEHISTNEQFKDFVEHEWKTGLDFQKEFDKSILLPRVNFDNISEELYNMKKTYNKIRRSLILRKNKGRKFIRFVIPHTWAHAEYILALLQKERGPSTLSKVSKK